MPFQPDYEVPQERQAYTVYAHPEIRPEKIGVLMLHGFMGSPASSRMMAEFLAENGITVHCPLLAGHGNLPYKIHNLSHKQWLAEAEEALAFMRTLCNQIFIVGHSMGAVLGAHLINKNDYPDICGFAMLAPFYNVPDWRINFVAIGRYFVKWFYPLNHGQVDRDIFVGRILDFNPDIDPDDPELQDWLVEESRLPVDGLDEMRKMGALGRKLWPKLHDMPVIIFQGGNDPAVNSGNTEKLFQKLPTPDKEMKLFPQVGHELMRPVEPIHSKVWQKTLEFIEEHAETGEKKIKPVLSGKSLTR